MTMPYPNTVLLDHLPGIIYVSDNASKTIQWCNKYFEQEAGYSLAEMNAMGMDFFRTIMHPDDFSQAVSAQTKFSENSQPQFYGFCRFRGKNSDHWEWVNGTAVPFSFDSHGNVKEVICMFLKVFPKTDTPAQAEHLFNVMKQIMHEKEWRKFTQKEKDVIALAVQGHSEKMMAQDMHIQPCTVEFHLRNIRRKLNVPNMQALISKVKDLGL